MILEDCCHVGVLCCRHCLFQNYLLCMFLICTFFCLQLMQPLVRKTCDGKPFQVLPRILHNLHMHMLCIQIDKVCRERLCLCQ